MFSRGVCSQWIIRHFVDIYFVYNFSVFSDTFHALINEIYNIRRVNLLNIVGIASSNYFLAILAFY